MIRGNGINRVFPQLPTCIIGISGNVSYTFLELFDIITSNHQKTCVIFVVLVKRF